MTPVNASVPGAGRGVTTLYYDPDCGFCTRVGTWLGRWLSVRPLPTGRGAGRDADEAAAVAAQELAVLGIDADRVRREIPAVLASGEVRYGAAAFAAALVSGPWWLRGLGWLLAAPGVSQIAERVYRGVAARRHQLPGGTAACQLP
ncbi:thiol-disulfide oxidoreductase DCC family protein [Propioniciclava soli]|uniref:DCC1-like thiol-disulfide oxidoreductase family protein n=1 Tax=Propioniciclava soli TaxID=2775081 RepID=A0ABZ3C897_9ACTN